MPKQKPRLLPIWKQITSQKSSPKTSCHKLAWLGQLPILYEAMLVQTRQTSSVDDAINVPELNLHSVCKLSQFAFGDKFSQFAVSDKLYQAERRYSHDDRAPYKNLLPEPVRDREVPIFSKSSQTHERSAQPTVL